MILIFASQIKKRVHEIFVAFFEIATTIYERILKNVRKF